jgi:uncharacterized protein (DUF2336 family)
MAANDVADVIAELEQTVRDQPPARCALMLGRVTNLLLGNADRLSRRQFDIFDEILTRLVERVDVEAVARVSEAIADLDSANLEIARRLAHHEEAAVAAPILQKSQRLPEADLLEIAACRGTAHRLAIAKRSRIADALADLLVGQGDTSVCVQLASNSGARFSQDGYSKLVAMAERNDELADLLVTRTDVPVEMLHELVASLPRSTRARLLKIATPELRGTIQTAIESVEIGICTPVAERVDYMDAIAKTLELSKLGKLNDSTVNRFAVWREHRNLIAALSLLATVPIETIEPLLQESDCYGLVVACRASRLNWTTTLAVIGNRPDQPKLSAEKVEQCRDAFEALNLSAAQRMIRFGSTVDLALKLQPPSDAQAKSGAM